MLVVIFSFVISYLLVAFMLPKILLLSLRKKLFDPIDPRKIHSVPASRLGGITFFPSLIFSSWLCIAFTQLAQNYLNIEIVTIDITMVMEVLALMTLFMVGVYDDLLGVPYKSKFVAQIFAALLIIISGTYFKSMHGLFGIDEIPAYLGIPMTLFIYVFVANAINLIDGIDGLASLLSITALFVYGLLMYNSGQIQESIFAAATLGALVPFCYHNVFGIRKGTESKIFMGDTGALVIGAILGLLAVKVWNTSYHEDSNIPINSIYYVLAYTMLIVPCFDVVRIIIHRYLDKKPLFLPDKNHIHHKFIALGCTTRQALLWIIAINISFMSMNLLLSMWLNITAIVAIDIVVWTLFHIQLSRLIKQHVKL